MRGEADRRPNYPGEDITEKVLVSFEIDLTLLNKNVERVKVQIQAAIRTEPPMD